MMFSKNARAWVSAVSIAVLGGCSVVPEARPVRLLDPAPEVAAPDAAPADWSLDIVRPETDPARDSTRVLVRTGDGRLQVQERMRWIAPPPDLLRTLLIRHLRDHRVVAEANAASGGAERRLAIDLRRFELDDASNLEAVVTLEARLYGGPRRALLARTRLDARQAAADASPGATNAAFESALADTLSRLSEWLAATPVP